MRLLRREGKGGLVEGMGGTEKLVFIRYESTWTPPDIVVNLDKVGAYDMIGKL